MNAIKKTYDEIPETVKVPEEFINKKGEIIFIIEDELQFVNKKTLKDFYGTIPDFPERSAQGEYEKRDEL
jgi:asparagine synthetase A